MRTSTAATTTSSAVAVAATTTTAAEAAHLSKTRINLLVRLTEDVDEIASLLGVCKTSQLIAKFQNKGEYERTISGEKGDRSSLGASTTSTTDTVDVILRVVGVVVVQDVGDVADILSKRLACKSRCL